MLDFEKQTTNNAINFKESYKYLKSNMTKSLQNMIDHYKNGLLETRNLQIKNKKSLTEVICDERLASSFL